MRIGVQMKVNITDIHSHIAYGIDDGAKNLSMSMDMLKSAYKQGVRNIVCTPHSDGDIAKCYNNIETLRTQVKAEGVDISLYSGCEIYCDDYNIHEVIAELNGGILPTINNTKYVLIEFYPYASTKEITGIPRSNSSSSSSR